MIMATEGSIIRARDRDKARHDDKGHIEREKEGTMIRARERDAR